MKKKDLMLYELPIYAEFVSIDWIQEIIARRITHKINKKLERYNNRLVRAKRFNNLSKGDKCSD